MTNPTYRKKMIEVTLPLVSINDASAKEKGNQFLKGHPRNLHQWWARRPLATCRVMPYAPCLCPLHYARCSLPLYSLTNHKDKSSLPSSLISPSRQGGILICNPNIRFFQKLHQLSVGGAFLCLFCRMTLAVKQ